MRHHVIPARAGIQTLAMSRDSRPRGSDVRRLAMASLVALAACGAPDRPAPPAADQYTPAAMVARFRRSVPERPTALGRGAATSADSLLARWVRGVEARDSAALAPLALTASEFAWLYYLDSPMARPPYELDPDVLWVQTASRSARGLARTLERYGGRRLGRWRAACEPPATSGALRLHACAVSFRPAGAAADVRLPLSVVERDGRFKLLGLATDL
jgi:hypothetical protein